MIIHLDEKINYKGKTFDFFKGDFPGRPIFLGSDREAQTIQECRMAGKKLLEQLEYHFIGGIRLGQ